MIASMAPTSACRNPSHVVISKSLRCVKVRVRAVVVFLSGSARRERLRHFCVRIGSTAVDGDVTHRDPDPGADGVRAVGHVGRRQVLEWLLTNEWGQQLHPRTLELAFRAARGKVDGPAGFRLHDLRHYVASLPIASGLDVEVVQARLPHASDKTTLKTYAHLIPDLDDSSRAAVAAVLLDCAADYMRTKRSLGG